MLHATTPPITLNSRVSLYPLSAQREDGVAIIGRGDQFLELPPEGLSFIAWLNEGLTLAEARKRFEAAFNNPFPDEEVLEVVNTFLQCDFIKVVDGQVVVLRRPYRPAEITWVRQSWAQAIFSRPALIAWLLFCMPAAGLWVVTPALWPRPADYFWVDYYFLIVLINMFQGLVMMALHESLHWLACRAKGINATITWTQRLGFMPLSQTIMHDIWAVPRPARFLPLAAGMMGDVLVMAVALYLLGLAQAGLLGLPVLVTKFLKFFLLTSTMALATQFWLFSKMDGYFLLSALLGQRNLQGDTWQWLKSRFGRSRRFDPPSGGMKYVYVYAVIMLVGGGLAIGQFLLVTLPIKLSLLWAGLLKIWPGSQAAPLDFADGVAVVTSQVIYWGLLVYIYWRDTLPSLKNQ